MGNSSCHAAIGAALRSIFSYEAFNLQFPSREPGSDREGEPEIKIRLEVRSVKRQWSWIGLDMKWNSGHKTRFTSNRPRETADPSIHA